MVSAITQGVHISVRPKFHEKHSVLGHFVFSYRIKIENRAEVPVQLLRRFWVVSESDGSVREIEGEGVIGLQPIVHPQESFEYTSGCFLSTEMGKMRGHYLMRRLSDEGLFKAAIPAFQMISAFKLN